MIKILTWIWGKISVTRLSKYFKIKALSHLPFLEKFRLLLEIFWLFLPENRAKSKVKGFESKFRKSFFIRMITGQLLLKNVGFNIFQFCSYRSQMTFQKNLDPDFQVWLLWLKFGTTIISFLKKRVRFSDAEFNAKPIGINFKSQKRKRKKLICFFYLLLFTLSLVSLNKGFFLFF